jgi:Asp-tRNA(Asn)/Glu-tRNA(Gln) amidotransferase A subunit family amidase/Asp-tRNA(Asn)/Glu-tRNA(Gln) amidotransferase C subunit
MIDRRRVLKALAGVGVGSLVFQRALAAQVVKDDGISAEMIEQAEWIAGLELSEQEREETAQGLRSIVSRINSLHKIELDILTPPAVHFTPTPTENPANHRRDGEVRLIDASPSEKPKCTEDLAFWPVTELAPLLRTRQISSVELTKLYLDRLHAQNEILNCVVTFTDDLAMQQAKRADREIAAGRYRGPLHGIPWGAKDLMGYPGYKTTWGAPQFKDQVMQAKSTVAQRLDDAGAVLIAKLALGAIAMGDKWFGGMTRNPWNPKEGSSGSSAGSASATAAGLVGFAIGSETTGSITSPCRRCGATGLRPTFGRVSRAGCMPLSWTLDKLGPITRAVEDCALVFDAIHGRDGLDATVVDRPFSWPATDSIRKLKVGYVENKRPLEERPEIVTLRKLGVQLVPIKLPHDDLPVSALTVILAAESADIFEQFTRSGDVEGMNYWPKLWRRAHFIPATEYLRANRVRSVVMSEMAKVMKTIDAYVGGNDVVLTNYTGHPCVSIPGEFTKRGGVEVPTAVTFTGQLFGETNLLALAHAYQQATDFHLKRPPVPVKPEPNKEPEKVKKPEPPPKPTPKKTPEKPDSKDE